MAEPAQNDMTIVQEHIKRPGPVDVPSIIRALGVKYVETPMPPDASGRIDHHNGDFKITVNADQSKQRRNFTAAHELAHYLLHRDLLKEQGHLDRLFVAAPPVEGYMSFSPRHEVEANNLAAQILMPREKVTEEMVWKNYDLGEMATALGVSRAALEVRLRVLGLDLERERLREAQGLGALDEDIPF